MIEMRILMLCWCEPSWPVSLTFTYLHSRDDAAFKSLSNSHPNYGKAEGMNPEDWWIKVSSSIFSLGNKKKKKLLSIVHIFSPISIHISYTFELLNI